MSTIQRASVTDPGALSVTHAASAGGTILYPAAQSWFGSGKAFAPKTAKVKKGVVSTPPAKGPNSN